MFNNVYETDLDKMALVVEATKVAKRSTVADDGVGSDLNINIFCWKNNELLAITQLKKTQYIERDKRIERIMTAGRILRQGWGVTEFTFAAEGYCTLKPSETKDHNLAKLFTQHDSSVRECLSFTHIQLSDDLLFVSVPYRIDVEKRVIFSHPLWYPTSGVMRDLAYPAALRVTLDLPEIPITKRVDQKEYFRSLAEGLFYEGFEFFYKEK